MIGLIKKFINSDFNKPLNTNIDNTNAVVTNGTYGNSAINTKVTDVQNKINNATYGLSAIQALVNRGVVKSVQRGTTSTSGSITISSVNINKTLVVGSGQFSYKTSASNDNYASGAFAHLESSTRLQVNFTGAISSVGFFHWQVIEFY